MVMIRLRVVYGVRRRSQVLPSHQNRQISALDETADAPHSSLFSLLLSSLFFSLLFSVSIFFSLSLSLSLSLLLSYSLSLSLTLSHSAQHKHMCHMSPCTLCSCGQCGSSCFSNKWLTLSQGETCPLIPRHSVSVTSLGALRRHRGFSGARGDRLPLRAAHSLRSALYSSPSCQTSTSKLAPFV